MAPYLLFLGDAPDLLAAKVAIGLRDWRPEQCIGQWRLDQCRIDLGLEELSPQAARARGAKTIAIGVANRGGIISESWLDALETALEAGYNIASGLHDRLSDQPRLVAAAARHGGQLWDLRAPQGSFPIGNGAKRTGKRCLAVGTDCSVGKMYTALALEKSLHELDIAASFRATGQTGIFIAGTGVPLDAIVADFMAGAVETITPANDAAHWDIVEGQGSLFHPSFSGVTLALIHGSQPDALILCHEPQRQHMRGLPHYALPSLEELRDLALRCAQRVNPDCQVIGVAVNTAAMTPDEARDYLQELGQRMQLPAVDPYRDGAMRLAQALRDL